jgi:hypothetical protein
MAMDFDFGQTATITHFNDPDVKVTLKRLSELEQMAHFQELSKFTVPVAVVRSDTGELIKDKDDNFVIHEVQNVPTSSFVKLLTRGVASIQGLRNKGVDLPLNEGTISLFWRRKMDEVHPHPKAGEPVDPMKPDGPKHPETTRKPFWSILVDALMDDKTFEPDPSDATSDSQ